MILYIIYPVFIRNFSIAGNYYVCAQVFFFMVTENKFVRSLPLVQTLRCGLPIPAVRVCSLSRTYASDDLKELGNQYKNDKLPTMVLVANSNCIVSLRLPTTVYRKIASLVWPGQSPSA